MNIVNSSITYNICFYEEPPEPNTFGSNDIRYEIYYHDGIMYVDEVGSFGDRTLVRKFRDKRNRGITLDEILENIKEISEMTYEEFKEKILNKGEK